MNKPSWFDSYISGNLSAGFALHYPKAECIGTGYVWQLGPALSMQVLFDEVGTILIELCESHGDAIEHLKVEHALEGIVHRDLPVILKAIKSVEQQWATKHHAYDVNWSAYNIPLALAELAEACVGKLTATATGGGIDYINRVLSDGGPQLILKADREPGSPATLWEPCEVLLELMEGFDQYIAFNFDTANDAILWMGRFDSADASNYHGGRI